ncbi:hypothetical protein PBC6_047 [Bacillus phage PBC6]|nr:hypothetical protein PBC6_047 [Bacillus phage PBC6]
MREQSESNHTHYIVYKDCRYNYNKTTTNNLYRKERITPYSTHPKVESYNKL